MSSVWPGEPTCRLGWHSVVDRLSYIVRMVAAHDKVCAGDDCRDTTAGHVTRAGDTVVGYVTMVGG